MGGKAHGPGGTVELSAVKRPYGRAGASFQIFIFNSQHDLLLSLFLLITFSFYPSHQLQNYRAFRFMQSVCK